MYVDVTLGMGVVLTAFGLFWKRRSTSPLDISYAVPLLIIAFGVATSIGYTFIPTIQIIRLRREHGPDFCTGMTGITDAVWSALALGTLLLTGYSFTKYYNHVFK